MREETRPPPQPLSQSTGAAEGRQPGRMSVRRHPRRRQEPLRMGQPKLALAARRTHNPGTGDRFSPRGGCRTISSSSSVRTSRNLSPWRRTRGLTCCRFPWKRPTCAPHRRGGAPLAGGAFSSWPRRTAGYWCRPITRRSTRLSSECCSGRAAEARDHSIIVPTHDGRRGHPTLIDWRHVAGMRALPAGAGLNVYLRSGGPAAGLRRVPVESPGNCALRPRHTPEDYERLRPVLPTEPVSGRRGIQAVRLRNTDARRTPASTLSSRISVSSAKW